MAAPRTRNQRVTGYFRENEVRLWLSLIAYNLGNLWPGRRGAL